jgi:ABC-type molybdenum transport system ATPase subunit/photorepair protein PhrA
MFDRVMTPARSCVDLITGEHKLSYAQEISLFGRRRGSGESIWDVRRRLGALSTKFHMQASGGVFFLSFVLSFVCVCVFAFAFAFAY